MTDQEFIRAMKDQAKVATDLGARFSGNFRRMTAVNLALSTGFSIASILKDHPPILIASFTFITMAYATNALRRKAFNDFMKIRQDCIDATTDPRFVDL